VFTIKPSGADTGEGGDFALVAPPGIWREKGKNVEIHNI